VVPSGLVFVEGHGELSSVPNLINRLWGELGLPSMFWKPPYRRSDLHLERGVDKACAIGRELNADALLILRDEDDACPRDTGPQVAAWIARQALPCPAAVALMHREYEALFLPCISSMAGKPLVDERGVRRPGLASAARFEGDPESIRGVKEWLTQQMPAGRAYKPTLDQLPLTRMIDFATVREAGLPCFGTLERALEFLADHRGRGGVYPPPIGEDGG
jgi:hypothetical protein